MIRPFSLFCFLLACGSGLYLYQSKHQAQMLDRQIEQTVRDAQAARDKTRLLDAEWTLLNDPERLRQLSDQFLALKPVAPGQFTTMAELDHRLPAVRVPETSAPAPAVIEPAIAARTPGPVVAQGAAPASAPTSVPASAASAVAPAPAPQRSAAPSPERVLVAEHKPSPPPAAPVPRAAAHPAEPSLPVLVASAPRIAPPASTPVAVAAPRYVAPSVTPISAPATVAMAAPLSGGSSLGMASRGALPPPKPVSLFPAMDGH